MHPLESLASTASRRRGLSASYRTKLTAGTQVLPVKLPPRSSLQPVLLGSKGMQAGYRSLLPEL